MDVLPHTHQAKTLVMDLLPAALGAAYTLGGRVTDAVLLLTPVMEQSMATEWVGPQALCRLSLGKAQLLAGHLAEKHAYPQNLFGHLSWACGLPPPWGEGGG